MLVRAAMSLLIMAALLLMIDVETMMLLKQAENLKLIVHVEVENVVPMSLDKRAVDATTNDDANDDDGVASVYHMTEFVDWEATDANAV